MTSMRDLRRAGGSRLSGLGAMAALLLSVGCAACRADRVVLAPMGDTLAPKGGKVSFLISPSRSDSNVSWLQFSTAQGIEMEIQRADTFYSKDNRVLFNVQYPLLPDFGTYPSLSIGIRNVIGEAGSERTAYVAVGHSAPLSDRQLKWLERVRFSAGAGTVGLDGLFAGMEIKFHGGVGLAAEVYRRRPNFGLTLPLVRNLNARAVSINGTAYYGLDYTWPH